MELKFLRNRLKNFKPDLAYEKWLMEFINTPNDKEFNPKEEQFPCANNLDFHPLQGA